MVKKFRVLVPEVHYAHHVVEAETKEDAIQKVMSGKGELDYLEYSHNHGEIDSDQVTEEEDECHNG